VGKDTFKDIEWDVKFSLLVVVCERPGYISEGTDVGYAYVARRVNLSVKLKMSEFPDTLNAVGDPAKLYSQAISYLSMCEDNLDPSKLNERSSKAEQTRSKLNGRHMRLFSVFGRQKSHVACSQVYIVMAQCS
jgi:hypothetical protein